MKKKFCKTCGAEIYVTWDVPKECYSATFEITEKGLVRSDNNDMQMYSPQLVFHCSDDMEHDIEPDPQDKESLLKWKEWEDEIEEHFHSVAYQKYC